MVNFPSYASRGRLSVAMNRAFLSALGCLALGWTGAGRAQNPLQPAVNPLTPLAYSRSQAFDLPLTGSQLYRPAGLWMSFPGQVQWGDPGAKSDPAKLTARIQPGAGTPVGLQLIRVSSPHGIGPARVSLRGMTPRSGLWACLFLALSWLKRNSLHHKHDYLFCN